MDTTLEDVRLHLEQHYGQPYRLGRISQEEHQALLCVFQVAFTCVPLAAAKAARAFIVETTPAR